MNIIMYDSDATWTAPVKRNGGGGIVEVFEHIDNDAAEKSDIPVFEAKLRYMGHFRRNTHSVRHLFKDEQTGMVHRFCPKTIETLLEALVAGDIVVSQGLFVGTFTLQLFSGWVFTTPLARVDRARLGLT